jgi:hypothetical protein
MTERLLGRRAAFCCGSSRNSQAQFTDVLSRGAETVAAVLRIWRACANRIQGRTAMTLRKIRIALVATILALTATATVSLHAPAQAGITMLPVD